MVDLPSRLEHVRALSRTTGPAAMWAADWHVAEQSMEAAILLQPLRPCWWSWSVPASSPALLVAPEHARMLTPLHCCCADCRHALRAGRLLQL